MTMIREVVAVEMSYYRAAEVAPGRRALLERRVTAGVQRGVAL